MLSSTVLVPGGLLIGGYAYVSRGDEFHPVPFGSWLVRVITAFPTRAGSRAWGYLNEIDLPVWLRKPILGAYSSVFGCNLEEVSECKLS